MVVTKITPLAALEPYIAAEASFKTVIFSILFGSILSKLLSGTPSTIINTLLSFMVLLPLIRKVVPSYPGSPLDVTATNPGSLPAKPLVTLVTGACVTSSLFMVLIEPVNVAFFCVPYPTTTISSRFWTVGLRITSTCVLPSVATLTVI